LLVSEVINLRPPAAIDLRLDHFRGQEPFEQHPQEGRFCKFGRGVDTEQVTGQPRIREIDLGRFDQTLAEIFVKGRHDQDLGRGLQNAEPLRDRRHADAQGSREIRLVENLPVPAGQECQEPPKGGQVFHGGHRPHVPFQVGLHERTEPQWRGSWTGHSLGITASEQAHFLAFARRKGPQLQHGCPSGHRLGYPVHQRGFLGAGEEPLVGPPRLVVDPRAHQGKDLGDMLNFIENGRGFNPVQKAVRVGAQTGDDRRILEEKIGGLRQ
jgi:hypothetical protein